MLAGLPRRLEPRDLGGYTHANITGLEGRYLCLRPAFSSSGVINAYIVAIERSRCCGGAGGGRMV
jgi:hypothetical protein